MYLLSETTSVLCIGKCSILSTVDVMCWRRALSPCKQVSIGPVDKYRSEQVSPYISAGPVLPFCNVPVMAFTFAFCLSIVVIKLFQGSACALSVLNLTGSVQHLYFNSAGSVLDQYRHCKVPVLHQLCCSLVSVLDLDQCQLTLLDQKHTCGKSITGKKTTKKKQKNNNSIHDQHSEIILAQYCIYNRVYMCWHGSLSVLNHGISTGLR